MPLVEGRQALPRIDPNRPGGTDSDLPSGYPAVSALSVSMILELSGHTVTTAHDGLKALETAADFHPDLVLLDIGLPKLNGFEVARRMRAEPWGKTRSS